MKGRAESRRVRQELLQVTGYGLITAGTRGEEIKDRYGLRVQVRLSEFTAPEGFQELLVWQDGYSLHHPSARNSADTEVTLETLLFGKSP